MVATIICYALALFFLVGAAVNLIGPSAFREAYARWGYPAGFRFITAALELLAAILLIMPGMALFGALLGAAIMLAAVLTIVLHREWSQVPPPLVALVACLACAWLAFSGSTPDLGAFV